MKTLKKFSLILVVIAMLFTVGGCSQEKETKTDNQTATTQNNKGSEKGNEKNKDEGSDYERADFLTKTYENPNTGFYIDTPAYHEMTEGASRMWNVDSQYFVIVAGFDSEKASIHNFKLEDVKELEDILPAVKFAIRISSYRKCYVDIKDLEVENTEKMTVAGREVLRFTGHFTRELKGEIVKVRYVVGYVTFFKNYPVYVVGVNSSEDQKQEYTDEITKVVDAMIKTLRDEK